MTGGDGNGAVDARCGGSEIEGQLLGALAAMHVSDIFVPVDTMDKRSLASAAVSCYSKPIRTNEKRQELPGTLELQHKNRETSNYVVARGDGRESPKLAVGHVVWYPQPNCELGGDATGTHSPSTLLRRLK
jgi:hypothetical protein